MTELSIIAIIRVVTADDPLGEPWPPSTLSTYRWHVARRTQGFTEWRRIELSAPDCESIHHD
jgi:hypothetical protein